MKWNHFKHRSDENMRVNMKLHLKLEATINYFIEILPKSIDMIPTVVQNSNILLTTNRRKTKLRITTIFFFFTITLMFNNCKSVYLSEKIFSSTFCVYCLFRCFHTGNNDKKSINKIYDTTQICVTFIRIV